MGNRDVSVTCLYELIEIGKSAISSIIGTAIPIACLFWTLEFAVNNR